MIIMNGSQPWVGVTVYPVELKRAPRRQHIAAQIDRLAHDYPITGYVSRAQTQDFVTVQSNIIMQFLKLKYLTDPIFVMYNDAFFILYAGTIHQKANAFDEI
ncbi:hypothetical protein D9M71_222370 [compost metagenome]